MMSKTRWKNLVSLQVALVAGLLVVLTAVNLPAIGQGDSTTASTTTSEYPIRDTSVYNGMGEPVPVRKDAWTWYWDEKAHIETNNSSGFWGDDAISNLFRNVSNSVLVPIWNGAMEYDFVRAGLLLVIAGMLLGLGASVFLKKEPANKTESTN
jgi:hypothetical protein